MTAFVRRQTIPRAVGQNRQRARSLEFAVPNGHYEIKMFDDDTTVETTPTFTFMVPRDLDGYVLAQADAFVSTVSSIATVSVQVHNVTQAVDMLTDEITIDPGEFTSCTAVAPPVIDYPNSVVNACDLVRLEVSFIGSTDTDADGLGVILEFSPP